MRTVLSVALCLALLLPLAGCGEREPAEPSFMEKEIPVYFVDEGPLVQKSDPVDDDWFADTAMIGHSLMRGIELYSGLETPDYYTLTGGSVSRLLSSREVTLPGGGTGRLADALEGHSYERFYLFMGINEIANNMDTLKSDYEKLVELVRTQVPEAPVYVLAVIPVTQSKASGGIFTLERIGAYNKMLLDLCEAQDCWYVDLYECFAGEDGYLPSTASTDGIHLKESEYGILLEYLKTHTKD